MSKTALRAKNPGSTGETCFLAETGAERAPLAPRGLCATCDRASHCTFPRDPERPVLECEEFSGLVLPPLTIRAAREAHPPASPGTRPAAPPALRGLCATCERRHDCTYPKPEFGVWHCDEFE